MAVATATIDVPVGVTFVEYMGERVASAVHLSRSTFVTCDAGTLNRHCLHDEYEALRRHGFDCEPPTGWVFATVSDLGAGVTADAVAAAVNEWWGSADA